MQKIKLLLHGFIAIISPGCTNHGHSHDNTANNHDTIK